MVLADDVKGDVTEHIVLLKHHLKTNINSSSVMLGIMSSSNL
jgi:hypothetical protein